MRGQVTEKKGCCRTKFKEKKKKQKGPEAAGGNRLSSLEGRYYFQGGGWGWWGLVLCQFIGKLTIIHNAQLSKHCNARQQQVEKYIHSLQYCTYWICILPQSRLLLVNRTRVLYNEECPS
jgi:hypothetical protein